MGGINIEQLIREIHDRVSREEYNKALEDLGNVLCDDLDYGYVFINKHQILHYVKKLKK